MTGFDPQQRGVRDKTQKEKKDQSDSAPSIIAPTDS